MRDWGWVLVLVLAVVVVCALVAWSIVSWPERAAAASKPWTWREWAVFAGVIGGWCLLDTLGDIKKELREIRRALAAKGE